MENFQNFKSSYKEKKAQNDLEEEIILNKLSLRKKNYMKYYCKKDLISFQKIPKKMKIVN